MKFFLGIDVGTASVRGALFNQSGELICNASEPITIYNFEPDFYEQSSTEIYDSVVKCIQNLRSSLGPNDEIITIGFDATCSLVVLDKNYDPVSVSPSNEKHINIIMWMDHRAKKQAEFINTTKYEGLRNIGGSISPEMDPPKILWLKQNSPEAYEKIEHFFSLPDFLVWKFTNQNIRSICSVTCKWLYKSNPNEKAWDLKFWDSIGLGDLSLNNFSKIGSFVQEPFKSNKDLKISEQVSVLCGLNSKVKSGISMIDAHAGGIGGICLTYGYFNSKKEPIDFKDILVLVSGTSSCFMASSEQIKFLNGIWGPYYEAMIPNMWLNEGGQSASGKLIDHFIQTHPAYALLKENLLKSNSNCVYDFLNQFVSNLTSKNNLKNVSLLTENIHVYPDYHGNRSPLADSRMTGMISGLNLDTSLDNLAILYLACLQSLAYQTKHIISMMGEFKVINIIGGLAQNRLYVELISDVCNTAVLVPKKSNSDTSVLFGSAILGSSNNDEFESYSFKDLLDHFSSNNKDVLDSVLIKPNQSIQLYHEKKYKVYSEMIKDQLKYKNLMQNI